MSLFNIFFFFNDTATTEIYTLSLHDALPILHVGQLLAARGGLGARERAGRPRGPARGVLVVGDRLALPRRHRRQGDRKSTRLNSSHANISYAVFCLKKKKKIQINVCKYKKIE